jgi:hypothetical protein
MNTLVILEEVVVLVVYGYVRLTPDSKLYGVSYDIYDIVNVMYTVD